MESNSTSEARHWFALSYRMGSDAFDAGDPLTINMSDAWRRGWLDAEAAARHIEPR